MTIARISAADTMELVRQLRSHGYVQGQDFDFSYVPEQHDSLSHQTLVEKHTIFTFYDDAHATWFQLKYA